MDAHFSQRAAMGWLDVQGSGWRGRATRNLELKNKANYLGMPAAGNKKGRRSALQCSGFPY